jgi:hypothetical protein
MRAGVFYCLLLGVCLVGCGGPSTEVGTSTGSVGVAASSGEASLPDVVEREMSADVSTGVEQPVGDDSISQPPAPVEPVAPPTPAAPPSPAAYTFPGGAVDPASAARPGTDRVKADVGVGVKGRGLDQHKGVLVAPAKAYFTMREKAIFQIQIPHAMQMYEALHGSAPRTHEQFMKDIIQANQIKLPDLPPGQRYVYDPQAKELMVERPAP